MEQLVKKICTVRSLVMVRDPRVSFGHAQHIHTEANVSGIVAMSAYNLQLWASFSVKSCLKKTGCWEILTSNLISVHQLLLPAPCKQPQIMAVTAKLPKPILSI